MGINTDAVQRLYVAYFNRPGDPLGMQFWEGKLPSTAATQAQLEGIANSFSGSAEYANLYSGLSNSGIVNQLYQNLFGRAAETSGLLYWAGELDKGTITFAKLALQLTYSAQGSDATAVSNKLAAANSFTNALDTSAEIVGYSGNAAAASARTWLAAVNSTPASLATATASVDTAVSNATTAGSSAGGQTFTLTTGLDSGEKFTGTPANDTFNSVLISQTGTGTTLNAGDALVGGAGTDTLNVAVSGANANATTTTNVNAVSLTGIERVAVSNFNTQAMNGTVFATTFDASLYDTSLNTLALASSSSTANAGDTAFTNVRQIVGAEMNNGLGNLGITYVGTVVAGTSDSMKLTLSNQTGGTFTSDGIETLNVVSSGSANTVTLAGAQLKTVNLTGSVNANLGTLAATVTKVDATGFTGGMTVTGNTAVNYTITGGDGNDTIAITTGLDSNDQVDAGKGVDTLRIAAPVTTANAAKLSGFEAIEATTLSATAYDASVLSSTTNTVTRLVASAAAGGNDITFANVGAGVTDLAVTGTEGIVATLKTDTTNDAVKLTYGTAATAIAAGTGVTVAGQTTLNNYETITIVSQGDANNTGNFSASQLKSLVVTGDKALTLGTIQSGTASISSIDASALTTATAAFIMSNNISDVASTITGGAGNDTLYGGNKADSISGGTGTDSIVAGTGNDTVLGGDGNDTIVGEAGVDSLDGGAGDDTFTVATTSHFSGLTTAEVVKGGDGNDTLSFTDAAGSTVVAADMTGINSIETVSFALVSATGRSNTLTLSDAVFTANGATSLKVTSTTQDATLSVDGSTLSAANSLVITTKSHDSDQNNAGGGAAARNDSLVGGAGNDTFNFTTSVNAAALDANDTVNGGKGSDTLNITLDTNNLTAVTLTSNVSNIETIRVAGTGALTAGIILSTDQFVTTTGTNAVTTVGVVDASGMTGSGAFTFDGNAESDSALSITGGTGADVITGGGKADTISGGDGADQITGGAGVDNLSGGSGDDIFIVGTISHFAALSSPEVIDGGAGNDTLRFTAAGTINSADLANVKSVETIAFTAASSTLVLADTYYTSGGITTVKVSGVSGTTVNGAAVVTSANSIAFTNTASAAANDVITGGAGNDTFAYNTYNKTDSAATLDGNDTIAAGAGTDTLALTITDTNAGTGAASTTITITNVSAIERITVAQGTNANDAGESLVLNLVDANFASGVAAVIDASGATGNFTLGGSAETDATLSVTGGSGDDSLTGGSKADTLIGGLGADQLTGGGGADVLTGGIGADIFIFAAATQSGGTAVDSITDFVSGTDKLQVTLDYSSISASNPVTVNATVLTAVAGITNAQASLSGERGQAIYDTDNSQVYINVNNDNVITTLDYTIKVNAASTPANTIGASDINFSVTGTGGADTITTGGGADTIVGGGGGDLIVAGAGADQITVAAAGSDTITGGQGADTINLTGTGAADTIRFAQGTGAVGITAATSLGSDTITNFTGGTDILNFSEAVFGDLNGTAGVAALDQTQVVVLANLATAMNTTNAQIDGSGDIAVTNGAFAVVGNNSAGQTVGLYFVSSTATVTQTITQALAAGTAVKIADISLIGSALALGDFAGIA